MARHMSVATTSTHNVAARVLVGTRPSAMEHTYKLASSPADSQSALILPTRLQHTSTAPPRQNCSTRVTSRKRHGTRVQHLPERQPYLRVQGLQYAPVQLHRHHLQAIPWATWKSISI